jgi:site-specific DNA-methyltransferase (cytosine-N4-specific)
MLQANLILPGNNIDTLKIIPDGSVDCCVTSPPYYGLRDYGTAVWIGGDPDCNHFRDNKVVNDATFSSDTQAKGDSIYKHTCGKCGTIREDLQIGLEASPEEYIVKLLSVFREVKRILKDEGTLWVNIGDTYNGSGKNNGNSKPVMGNSISKKIRKFPIKSKKENDLVIHALRRFASGDSTGILVNKYGGGK